MSKQSAMPKWLKDKTLPADYEALDVFINAVNRAWEYRERDRRREAKSV